MSWIAAILKPCVRPGQKSSSAAREAPSRALAGCSLCLNAGRLDHLAPLLGTVDDEFAELGG